MSQVLTDRELETARQAIRQIAASEGVSEAKVREEITVAIRAALDNPDPQARALWATIPKSGEIPTPEELMTWVAKRVKDGGTV